MGKIKCFVRRRIKRRKPTVHRTEEKRSLKKKRERKGTVTSLFFQVSPAIKGVTYGFFTMVETTHEKEKKLHFFVFHFACKFTISLFFLASKIKKASTIIYSNYVAQK